MKTRLELSNLGNRFAELAAEDLAEELQDLPVQRAVIGQQMLGRRHGVRRPVISLIAPPASVTSSVPAAISQGLSPNSQKASRRPQAT